MTHTGHSIVSRTQAAIKGRVSDWQLRDTDLLFRLRTSAVRLQEGVCTNLRPTLVSRESYSMR